MVKTKLKSSQKNFKFFSYFIFLYWFSHFIILRLFITPPFLYVHRTKEENKNILKEKIFNIIIDSR